MFSRPMEQISFETVEDFCRQGVEEGVRLDYKAAFPKDLAKLLAAFANTYGGMILIGVGEKDRKPKLPIDGVPLERGLAEQVTSVGLEGVYPPVFPEVQVCTFASSSDQEPDRAVVVIRVHQSDQTPHAIENKTKVYLRVDSQSKPFELATIDQIEWLQRRREAASKLRYRLEGLMAEHSTAIWALESQSEDPNTTTRTLFTNTIRATPVFPGGVGGPFIARAKLLQIAQRQPLLYPSHDPGGMDHHLRRVDGGIAMHAGAASGGCYSEVNEHGLVLYQERGVEPAIFVGAIGRSVLTVLRYAVALYKSVGFFGLFDLELELAGVAHRTLGRDTQFRSADDVIVAQHRASVDVFRETEFGVVARMVNALRWAFDTNELDEAAVRGMVT